MKYSTGLAVFWICCVFAGCSAYDGEGGCDDRCVRGWWTVVTGGCSAICSLTPQPRECSEDDCEQLELYHLRGDGGYDGYLASHSPESRILTVLAPVSAGQWSTPSPCRLSRTDDHSHAGTFACGEETIEWPARVWARAPGDLASRLENLSDDSLPCEHSY